jgi:hypothetical protein
MILSIDTEKAFEKIWHHFMIKTEETRNWRYVTQHYKAYIWQIYCQHHTKWRKTETTSIKVKNETGLPAFSIPIQYSLEFLARAIRQKHEIKGIWIGKEEVKLSLFADDMILYLRNPKNSIKKLLESIKSFCKAAGHKISIQKSVASLYNNNGHTE